MRLASVLALAAVGLPCAARAAVKVLVNGGTSDVLVGAANCKTLGLNITWTLPQVPVGGDKVQVLGLRSASNCTSLTVSDPDKVFFTQSPPAAQAGAFVVTSAQQMVILSTSDGGVSSTCDDPLVTARTSANPLTTVACVQYQFPPSLTTGTQVDTGSVNVSFALAKPQPPTNLDVAGGDLHLRISWSPGDAAEKIGSYDVHVVPAGQTPDGGPADTVTGTSDDLTHTDDGTKLQNDAGYSVTVVATDVYGNVSDPSAAALGSPHAVADFYNHYRDVGGGALGGCSSGGTGAWVAGLALVALLFARRKRKGALLALALLAPAARAADPPPRKALIGFDIGRYDPQVDSESSLNGATPYHDVFGSRKPLRYQLEVDWEVAHPFGSLLVGGKIGFWQNAGKAVELQPVNGQFVQSQDSVTLDIIPFSALLTWRFDWLADRYPRFPFVPYAQAGLSRALWISYNGTGSVSHPERVSGGSGSGWTNGYTTALGMALNLNAIDPSLAREAYIDTGIQRSSLFAEYGWTHLDNFGKSGALILSDKGWRFGLAVEF